MDAGEQFQRLVEIMRELRENCPWDRMQTLKSLRQYLLEETYEALEALDGNDFDALRDELGDLLLQVVFLSRLAEEEGHFDVCGVIDAINRKLIRRHPHVFADSEADSPEEVLREWEHIKTHEAADRSYLDGVPAQLPALLKAVRTLNKMERAGLDIFDGQDAAALARDALERIAASDAPDGHRGQDRAVALLLLATAKLSDKEGVSPEDALRERVDAIIRRFKAIEARSRETGRALSELSEADLAKAREELLGGDAPAAR